MEVTDILAASGRNRVRSQGQDVANVTSADVESSPPRPDPDIPDDPMAAWPSLQRVSAQTPLRRYLQEMWGRRHFALAVPAGELRAQNQDTLLGQLWHLLNPLLLTAVYWLVFGTIFQRDVGQGVPYIAFLVSGIIPFQFTQKSIMQGAKLIHANRNLIQSVHFPRGILPFSAVAGELMAHGSALAIMLAVIGVTDALGDGGFGSMASWAWLWVIPITLVQALFNLGLALFASRLTFHFRDIQNIIPYVMRLIFYLSGILFPLGTFTEDYPVLRTILEANPINAFVDLMRQATLYGGTDPGSWALAGAWTLALLVGGFAYFRAAETEYGRV